MDIFKKDTIIKRTIELAGKINKLENDVADLAVKLATAERELEEKEAELILNGTVDGKNAEVRKAQLLQHTKNELDRIAKIKADYTKNKAQLSAVQEELKALSVLAKLMDKEE